MLRYTLYMSDIATAHPLLGTMTLSKLNTIAPNSNYAPSISILSNCLCLAPIAGLQLLLDSHKAISKIELCLLQYHNHATNSCLRKLKSKDSLFVEGGVLRVFFLSKCRLRCWTVTSFFMQFISQLETIEQQ